MNVLASNNFLSIVVSILEIILILGLLVSIHEAGHFGMAKAFNVYCFEYSIGFGPALIHKKRKKGETYFSLRVIPLGGYCSMYGEPGAVPDGFEEPPAERSLESVAKWKKALILVAGVVLNFILGLVLIFVSDIAFPQYYFAYQGKLETPLTSEITNSVFAKASYPEYISSYIDNEISSKGLDYKKEDYYLLFPASINSNQTIILSSDATISGNPNKYVVTYYPSTLLKDHDLSSSIIFYPVKTKVDENEQKIIDTYSEYGITALPDLSVTAYDFANSSDGVEVSFTLPLVPVTLDEESGSELIRRKDLIRPEIKLNVQDKKIAASNVSISKIEQWLGWNRAWKKWSNDVPRACGAVVQGFASLFTKDGFKNISGIVGMTAALPSIQSSGGAANIFFFAGLISINLAFFNLLPFPALDGWALVVTAVEAITKKKVPAKAQSIMSIVGFVLLFGLMIAVTIKDIISII